MINGDIFVSICFSYIASIFQSIGTKFEVSREAGEDVGF